MSLVQKYLTPAVLVLAASGCDAKLSEADFLREYVSAACSWYARCGFMKDEAACVAALTPTGGIHVPAGVVFDADKAQECLDLSRARVCGMMTNEPGLLHQLATCEQALRGTFADGAACVDSTECASGFCQTDPCDHQCCSGTCYALRKPGDECTGSGPHFSQECPEGTTCDCLDGPCTCKGNVADGERCWSLYECRLGSTCVYDVKNSTNVCQRTQDVGASCTPGLSPSACAWNLWCDPATSQCAPRLETGATCMSGAPMCSGLDICQNSKCAPPPGPGEACADGACALGSVCVAGQCQRWVSCE
jgi:hypothetical protein